MARRFPHFVIGVLFLGLILGISVNVVQSAGRGDKRDSFVVLRYPDPVSVQNLSFFYPSQDISIPCHIPIQIYRAYNNFIDVRGVFGPRWTFNYGTFVRESMGDIVIVEADGYETTYSREGDAEKHRKEIIEQIVAERRKDDFQKGKKSPNDLPYANLRKYLMENPGTIPQYQNLYLSHKKLVIPPGRYKSLSRGTSELVKDVNGYQRIFRDGQKEVFHKKGQLIRIFDRNGNQIDISYERELPRLIRDSCKRSITLSYDNKGHVIQITDSLGKALRYEYYPNGYLKKFTDASKHETTYFYDPRGFMTKIIYPASGDDKTGGTSSDSITYDDKGFVVAQEDSEGKQASYKMTETGSPKVRRIFVTNYDKGQITGKEVHEFEGTTRKSVKVYNAKNILVRDETTTLSACCGRPVSVTDKLSDKNIHYEYDAASGNLTKRTDSNGFVVRYEYEPIFNQVYRLTDSSGGDYYFFYDKKGNLTDSISVKDQFYITLSHNNFGKIVRITKHLLGAIEKILPQLKGKSTISSEALQTLIKGARPTKKEEISFDYNFFGKPTTIRLTNTGAIDVQYYATGDIKEVDATPDQAAAKRFQNTSPEETRVIIIQEVRSALQDLLDLLRPANMTLGL